MKPEANREWPVYLSEKLQSKLALIPEYPMTVVSAPLGYGKTVTMRAYLERCAAGILWSTVYNDDADGFFTDFCIAFAKEDGAFSDALKGAGMPRDSHARRQFIQRLEAFCAARERPVFLVLDQMELAADQEVRGFLHFFIRQMPSGFHLVLIGRARTLQLDSDFLLSGLVHFISCEDFELSLTDIEQYAKMCKLALPNGATARLFALTGGWMTLIRMNLREYREFGGIYTQEEMLQIIEVSLFEPLEPEKKQMLKAVSVCDSFSKEQACFLYNAPEGERLLDSLVNDAHYIRFHRPSGKYLLFAPLAAYLKAYHHTCPRAEFHERMNRLACWYLQKDENALARRIFHSVQNYSALMEAVEKRRFIVHYGLDEQEFISYYTDCPPQIRAQHPKAIMTFARQMFALGNREMGMDACKEFISIMCKKTDMPSEERRQLMGTYELLLSYAQYNDLPEMLAHLHKAKELLGSADVAVPWPDTGLNDASSLLFMYHRKLGCLREETRLFSEYAPLYSSLIGGRMDGADLLMQSERLFLLGDVQEADILLNKAVMTLHRDTQWSMWLCAVTLQVRIGLVEGSWETVRRLIDEVKTAVAEKNENRLFPADMLLEIFVYGKLGLPYDIPARMVERLTSRQTYGFRAVSMLHYTYGEALLAARSAVKLLALADSYLESARKYPNLYAELMLEIEIAAAYELINDRQKAETHLVRALEIADPDGILMPFVEMYRYIRSIAERLSQRRMPLLQNILLHGQAYVEGVGRILGKHFSQVNHGLTSRELEIAKLAAKRLSNQEIANRLGISESTVKTQLARAFSKLEIQKRRDLAGFFPS